MDTIKTKLLAALMLTIPNVTLADDLIFSNSFEGPCGTDCPPPVNYCESIASDPLVQPAGRAGVIRPWPAVFSNTVFYTPTTYLHPVGSISMFDRTHQNRWLQIPFTTGLDEVYRLDWVEAQSLFFPVRYNGRPAHSAYFTISPCPGDFRLENNQSDDPWLKRGCRKSGNINQITFRSDILNSTTSNCALKDDTEYWLNIGFFEPGELDPLATTCITGTKCEVNVQVQ